MLTDVEFMARVRIALATTGDGDVHVIHCDRSGCGAMEPFPGPERVAREMAGNAGWDEDDEGAATCPECRRTQ